MAFSKEFNENSVRYLLYWSESSVEALNEYKSKCYTSLAPVISDHIWHNQSFHLTVRADSSGVHHLEGITNFGDNIDDEWLIVYLLFRLSGSDPNLVIKVEDSDGDLLLIEAANDLPKWCEPSNCVNRVYIFREAVHIIGRKCKAFENRIPSVSEAVDYIRLNPHITRSQDKIQKCISKRIDCFPNRIKEYEHKSHCYVPIGVAALLKHNPSLIALAVNAFYSRTPDDLRACQAMKYFPPESRVMRCVTFTRCLYAQLMAQSYAPDARVGWNLPKTDSRDFKSHDLGMKIASGFEILISNSKCLVNNENNNEIDFSSDQRWIAFFERLTKNGYFGRELNGSKKYRELLRNAKNYFSDLVTNNEDPEEWDSYESKGSKIYKILESLEIDEKEFENEAKNLENEDNDQWINIDSEELDALLSQKFCSTNQSNHCSDLSTQIPATLQAFVSNPKSGLKGAEAPTRPQRKNKINFNEEAFSDALSTVLSFKVPQSETDSSSSGMSDYSDDTDSVDSDDDFYHDLNRSDVNDTKEEVQHMKAYMEAMDQQLAETSIGHSFGQRTDSNQTNEELKAVDIDLNALTNILQSYSSESGVPGPATALFASMGVKLPDNADQ